MSRGVRAAPERSATVPGNARCDREAVWFGVSTAITPSPNEILSKPMNWKLLLALLLSSTTVPFGAIYAQRLGDLREQTLIDDRSSEKDFKKLFNGKDLTGWNGDPRFWSVKDGAITGETTAQNQAKQNTFLIWTNETVSDFELRLAYKIVANNDRSFGDSGV